MDSEKPQLPYGWVVKQSKTYPDRVYYFNVYTNASSWEFPDLLQPYMTGQDCTSPPVLSAASLINPDPSSSNNLNKTGYTSGPIRSTEQNRTNRKTHIAELRSKTAPYDKKRSSVASKGEIKTTNPQVPKPGNSDMTRDVETTLKTLQKCLKNGGTALDGQKVTELSTKLEQLVKASKQAQSSIKPLGCTLTTSSNRQVKQLPDSIRNNHKTSLPVSETSSVGKNTRSSNIQPKTLNVCTKSGSSDKNSSTFSGKSARKLVQSGKRKVETEGSKSDKAANHSSISNYYTKRLAKLDGSTETEKLNKTQTPKTATLSNYYAKRKASMDALSPTENSKEHVLTKPYSSEKKSSREITKKTSPTTSVTQKRTFSPIKYPKYSDTSVGSNNKRVSSPLVSDKISTRIVGKCQVTTAANQSQAVEKQKNTSDKPDTKAKSSEPLSKRVKTVSRSDTVSENEDKRKVVKAVYKSSRENRNVSLKSTKLTNFQPITSNRLATADVDLTVNTSVKSGHSNEVIPEVKGLGVDLTEDGSGRDDGDRNNNTHFKVFIGNKDKLLSIQSWINTVDEGAWSDSSSQDCGLFAGVGNISADSGYASVPRVSPTERGWPGELKKSDITLRNIVAMEIDDCLVPSQDVEAGNLEEEMDIGQVLLEIREVMRTNPLTVQGVDYLDAAGNEHLENKSVEAVQSVLVVVDTNVLMNNIDMLDDLKDWHIQGCGKPCLYIPWIVLLELDKLKETVKPGRPSVSLKAQHQARKAISFLKALFAEKHPRLIGQTAKQFDEARTEFQAVCNDDVILQACLQCHKQYPWVVLFSNDNVLATKCLVTGIPAFNSKEILNGIENIAKEMNSIPGESYTPTVLSPVKLPAEIPPITSHSNQSASSIQIQTDQSAVNISQTSNISATSHTGVLETSAVKTTPVLNNTPATGARRHSLNTSSTQNRGTPRCLNEEKPYTLKTLVDDLYCKMKMCLHETMGRVLEVEMKIAYNDIWKDILYRKPPWSLKDILECWKKHWIAVFGLVLPRRLIHNIHTLLDHFSYTQGHSIETMLKASNYAVEVLEECCKRNMYGDTLPRMTKCVTRMNIVCSDVNKGSLTPAAIGNLDQYLKTTFGTVPAVSLHWSNTASPRGAAPDPQSCPQGANDRSESTSSSQIKPTMQTHAQTHSQVQLPERSLHNPVPQTIGDNSTTKRNLNQSTTSANQNIVDSVNHSTNIVSQTGSQNVDNSLNQSIVEQQHQSSQVTGSDVIMAAAAAGQRLEQIWKFIHRSCEELDEVINSPQVTAGVENKLNTLVTASMQLRKVYAGLLELPVEELRNHEPDFVSLCNMCNNFFTLLSFQVNEPLVNLSPNQFLILYSLPQHRGTLSTFLGQIDEMLRHLYQCIQVIAPDD